MNALNRLLDSLKMEANVHHNGQYCGEWAVDISGTRRMTFHVVSKGSCFFEVDDQTIKLEEGDAVFMPSDARHCVTNEPRRDIELNRAEALPMTQQSDQPTTGLVCGNFVHQHPVFDKLVSNMPQWIVVRRNDDSATRQVIDLIVNESRSSDHHKNVLLDRLADCLFFLLIRNNLDVNNGVFAAFAHPNLSHAMDLIHDDTNTRHTLEELATAAAMSRSAFSTLFRSVVEQTPMDYVTQWRMTQAYRWLADDHISTFDAAIRCGYETEASFSKAFKRVMGVGPGAVRANSED